MPLFWLFCPLISLFCLLVVATGRAPFTTAAQKNDDELQMGQEVFNELKTKGEIVESSPLYDQLRPIADAITRIAQPQYNHPFKFYLVHETQPNAFATPGGNIYVVDSLLFFVKNTEQLAGTLCHEVSHTIHHDTITLIEKQQKIEKRELGAAVLLGPSRAHILAIALLGKLHSLKYSRDMEEGADLTGSDICASAGYNPWGLVWLFQDFKNVQPNQRPQLLSDHPNDHTGSRPWNSTSAKILLPSENLALTQEQLNRSLFRRTLQRHSCTEAIVIIVLASRIGSLKTLCGSAARPTLIVRLFHRLCPHKGSSQNVCWLTYARLLPTIDSELIGHARGLRRVVDRTEKRQRVEKRFLLRARGLCHFVASAASRGT